MGFRDISLILSLKLDYRYSALHPSDNNYVMYMYVSLSFVHIQYSSPRLAMGFNFAMGFSRNCVLIVFQINDIHDPG